MKLWWHKLTHWEYWPAYIIYLPTFFFWLGCMIRFRSFRFYSKSNPAFKNGGLYDDGKKSIYHLLPVLLYPKTILISNNTPADLNELVSRNGFSFPLIVKPDVGLRGIGVKKVNDIASLLAYRDFIKKDFLIQEQCNYPNEIGLFYCRFPSQKQGTITGITIKEFLKITGDGVHSIHDLLLLNPRYEMQIQKLNSQMNLEEILPLGETRCLVPFGNHNRGTAFLDGQELITPKLIETFDAILNKIDGFYYGRLDIRYDNFKDLEAGKQFMIIEINGAKSEPTHIYDPKHSLWFAQKEILRHQQLFYRVVSESYRLQSAFS
jgi:hypothetical protein